MFSLKKNLLSFFSPLQVTEMSAQHTLSYIMMVFEIHSDLIQYGMGSDFISLNREDINMPRSKVQGALFM